MQGAAPGRSVRHAVSLFCSIANQFLIRAIDCYIARGKMTTDVSLSLSHKALTFSRVGVPLSRIHSV